MKQRNLGSTLDSFFAERGELAEVRKMTTEKVRQHDGRRTMTKKKTQVEVLLGAFMKVWKQWDMRQRRTDPEWDRMTETEDNLVALFDDHRDEKTLHTAALRYMRAHKKYEAALKRYPFDDKEVRNARNRLFVGLMQP